MIVQYSEGLTFLENRDGTRSMALSEDVEDRLADFYERIISEDYEAFAISREAAPGLYTVVEAVGEAPESYGPYIKGQTTGPITFAASVTDRQGRPLLHNPEILEALVKGLTFKALWQVHLLASTGKRPILFLDEPYLSGFGSAFTPIQRNEVLRVLREVLDFLKKKTGVLTGIHCCGNTDWAMILESGTDIVNFDAFRYMEHFLLYPGDIARFLARGGAIAWGLVPTAEFTGNEVVEDLLQRLHRAMEQLEGDGVASPLLKEHALLTPACGMATMDEASAQRAVDLLAGLRDRCRASSGLRNESS
jgi:methionine synthase II (cobalamin-independent)